MSIINKILNIFSKKTDNKESNNNDSLKVLLDYSWRYYDKQVKMFDQLDTKASYLTGFIGIFFTLLSSALFPLFIKNYQSNKCYVLLIVYLFKFSILALLVIIALSLIYSIYSLNIKDINDISSINSLREYLKKMENNNILEISKTRKISIYVINAIEISTKNLAICCLDKSNKLKISVNLLLYSIILSFINILLFNIINILI